MKSRSYNFLWLSMALFPLLVVAMLLPVQPHDYWWYLRLGRETLQARAAPTIDTFGATPSPITYQGWLAAVILWLIFQAGGVPLTVLLTAVLIGATYGLLWILLRRAGIGARLATIVILFAGLSGANNWSIRPQLFAYPLFVVALWLLLEWQERRDKFLWALIPVGWLWTNLHGSFILLFILLGISILFGGGDRKKLLGVAALTFLASLINPRGWVLWASTLSAFTSPVTNQFVTEWALTSNAGWQMNIFFAWFILLIPLASFANKRVSIMLWAIFVVFSWLAFSGIRFVIWELFILATVTAYLLPDEIIRWFDGERKSSAQYPLNYGLGILFLLIPLILLPNIRDLWMRPAPPALAPETPVQATEWLAQHPELPNRMWNEFIFGSYFIHALPERPVWFDTRFQMAYSAEQVNEYILVQFAKPGWDDYLRKNKINLLALAHYQSALIAAVQSSAEWREEYRDAVAIIFSRRAPLE